MQRGHHGHLFTRDSLGSDLLTEYEEGGGEFLVQS